MTNVFQDPNSNNKTSLPDSDSPLNSLELNNIEKGSQQTNPKASEDSSFLGLNSLKSAEDATGNKSNIGSSDQQNYGYWKGPEAVAHKVSGGIKAFFWGTAGRKRSTISAGLISLLIGGGLFGLMSVSATAEIIQLADVLRGDFDGTVGLSLDRGSQLLRFATADDIGETRLGLLGRRVVRPLVEQLQEAGITFDKNSIGDVNGATIDTEALETRFPELQGLTGVERQDWIAHQFNINYDDIEPVDYSSSVFHIDASDFPQRSLVALLGDSVSTLNNGIVESAIQTRLLADYFGIPSLFHPIERLTDAALRRYSNYADSKKMEEDDEQEADKPVEQQADTAETDVLDKESTYGSFAAKALLFTGAACFLRSVASDIDVIDRDRIMLPAAVEATRMIAVGSQIQSGQDISAAQVGAVFDNLSNSKGQSVWQGQALEATAGENYSSGVPMSPIYKQAFSGSALASDMTSYVNKALDVVPGGANFICSKAGIALQILASLGIGFLDVASDAVTDGATTPAVLAYWAAREGDGFIVSAVAFGLIKHFILNATTLGKLAKDAFSGPSGGNLLAYGARSAANDVAISDGGVRLSNTQSSQVAYNQQQQSNRQFQNEDFFARVFNIDDYQSLFGKLADLISPNFFQNITNTVGLVANIGQVLPSTFASLIPSVYAQTTSKPYPWGFSLFGIPSSVLNNPKTQNPYANATDVMALLNTINGPSYLGRINTCFGVNVDLSNGNVSAGQLPNTLSTAYQQANCTDPSLSWQRIMLFVADNRIMDSIACYQGDSQSCSNEGL